MGKPPGRFGWAPGAPSSTVHLRGRDRLLAGSIARSCTACDGHHKMSDFGDADEPVHSGGESVAAGWPHQRRMVRAAWMEKIMTKSANASQRELQDSELDSVSGGESFGPVVQGMLDLINQQSYTPPATPQTPCGGRPMNLRAVT
jgi:hypothetical protein